LAKITSTTPSSYLLVTGQLHHYHFLAQLLAHFTAPRTLGGFEQPCAAARQAPRVVDLGTVQQDPSFVGCYTGDPVLKLRVL
jgi:hypothetical protein